MCDARHFETSRTDADIPRWIHRRRVPFPRVKLCIPFHLASIREEAKAVGCVWDSATRTWTISQRRAAMLTERLRAFVIGQAEPGGATSVVFDSGIQYGWGLTLSNATWANWTLPVGGGGIAACATLQPQGVLGWQCFPGCHDLFTGGPVRLTVREAQSVTGYPAGGSNGGLNDLPVKLLISRASFNETNAVGEAICQGTPMLNGNTTSGPPGAERVQP